MIPVQGGIPRTLAEDEEGNAVRDSGRPGAVRILVRAVLAAALLLAVAGNQFARAQDEFDLPELDDYSGLQAITANSVDGVNVRAEPGVESEIIISVPDGNVVDLRVDDVRTVTTDDGIRWWPITIWEVDGWVAGIYLAPVDGEADSGDSEASSDDGDVPADEDAPADSGDPSWAAGDYVASTTDFLAMRAGPGTGESRIAWLGLGDVVQIVDGPFYEDDSDWWLISDGSINAYVFGGYLTAADELDLEAPEEPAAAFAAGDTVGVMLGSGGANIRNEASAKSKRLGSLNEGAIVTIIDGPAYDSDGGAWYLVDLGDDTRGYVTGEVFEILTAEQVAAAVDVPQSGPTGTYHYPLEKYTFTQGYGCTIYSFEPYNATLGCPYHNGIDLAAPLGTPMLASDGGTIKYAGWCDCGLGLYIEIDHENGTSTVYGHMNAVYVDTGDKVNQGDVIGEIGSTGFSTGPHVHFMLKIGDSTVDPLGYLSE